MYVYLRAKFEVSSIILTRFRLGVNLPPASPLPQNKPRKSPPISDKENGKKGELIMKRVHVFNKIVFSYDITSNYTATYCGYFPDLYKESWKKQPLYTVLWKYTLGMRLKK